MDETDEMDKHLKNPEFRKLKLLESKSEYLREAAYQPVNWFPYCREAFQIAKEEDKLILIDIGASWCHWCHVMDDESYSDGEIAKFLNENFVCIKVDRDEMPAVDRKYQEAIAAITGQGGWPLTVFALPSGEVFYGGTYFPKEKKFGKPPFLTVLKAVLRAYKEEKEKTKELASQIMKQVEKRLELEYPADLSDEILKKGLDSVLRMGDPVYGGFGFSQKFPMPTAVRFLLSSKDRFNDAIKFADHTLEEMWAGGIRDHVFGGFFRYTVDREWTTPHFEKISYDNGELMLNYAVAFRNTGKKIFGDCALEIFEFLEEFLFSKEGYYTSIDADFRSEEGGFYTYTFEEIKNALEEIEFKAVRLVYGITRDGNFHGKNHLRIDASYESVAEELKLDVSSLGEILENAKKKLRRLRSGMKDELRIDKSIYTAYNSIISSGLIYVGLIMQRDDLVKKGIWMAEKIYSERFEDILYREEGLPAFLEDYAFLISALVDSYTASLNQRHLELATELLEASLQEFFKEGRFIERDGAVTIYDLSYRSPLSQMISNLNALGFLGEEKKFLELSESLLKKYAGMDHGLFDAGYLLALQSYLEPVMVEGDIELLRRLTKYINHDFYLKEGEEAICIGTRCLKVSEDEMDGILEKRYKKV
ncbi:MAG: thioredoxin domain-containing protein [Archaeoglobus sp.]|nr:thioredoxin domain-containing protein [Archaeoglobus sp.]